MLPGVSSPTLYSIFEPTNTGGLFFFTQLHFLSTMTTFTWNIANLERETADGFVFTVHYTVKVAEIEAALQAQLDEQAAPTKASGLPWVNV